MSRLTRGLILGLIAMLSLGCYPTTKSAQGKPAGDEFASDRTGSPSQVPFDAKRAMAYLEGLCKLGTRVSGSEGMKKQQDLLKKHFEDLGGKVTFQRFPARQKSQRQSVEMANLIVSWNPDRLKRVILCSHYDTRPIADQEPDRKNWSEPFLSANDGGSGVALLMELAHHMKDLKTEVGIDFVFFDGEEYIFNPAHEAMGGDKYFFGSENFAAAYRRDKPRHRYIGAVLLDMIGGKDAQFPVERNSWIRAGALVEQIWKIAAEQRCTAFQDQLGPDVLDDHLALNQAGIPAIDIIDFDYKHWHRLSDVPANCSGVSLEQVARVLGVWLQRVK